MFLDWSLESLEFRGREWCIVKGMTLVNKKFNLSEMIQNGAHFAVSIFSYHRNDDIFSMNSVDITKLLYNCKTF